jgi:hypothetical protein
MDNAQLIHRRTERLQATFPTNPAIRFAMLHSTLNGHDILNDVLCKKELSSPVQQYMAACPNIGYKMSKSSVKKKMQILETTFWIGAQSTLTRAPLTRPDNTFKPTRGNSSIYN